MGAPQQNAARPPRAQSDDNYIREIMRASAQREAARAGMPKTVAPSGPAGGGGGRVALKTVPPSGTREQNPERRAFFKEEQRLQRQAFMEEEQRLQFHAQEKKLQELSRKLKKAKTPEKKKELTKMLEVMHRRAG
jgi:hypothetical protein